MKVITGPDTNPDEDLNVFAEMLGMPIERLGYELPDEVPPNT